MGIAAFPIGRSGIAVVEYAWAAGIYLLLPGAEPLILGRQSAVLPDLDGHLIIVSSPRGRTTVSGLAADLRVRWQWHSPDMLTGLSDTPFGLVLERHEPSGGDSDLVLVERESGGVHRALGRSRSAVAVGTRAVAWVPAGCADGCSLAVGDLRTGARHDYPMPAGRMPESGAFSPDGRSLALAFPASDRGTGYVGVLDLQTGSVVPVPELRTAADLGAYVAWSSDSRWLVVSVRWPDRQRIAMWRPGDELRVLPTGLSGRAGPLTVLR